MFKRELILLCAALLLLSLFGSGALEAQTISHDGQPQIADAAIGSKTPENLTAELSSVITPPATLASLIGTAVNWGLVYVVVTTPALNVGQIKSSINWGGLMPSGGEFTTCTITLSSPPPGPCYISLGNALAPISSDAVIDSLTLVVTKASYPNWFPANLSTTYTYAYLTPQGEWYTDNHDIKTTGTYPALQWQPAAATITYQ